MLHNSHAKHEYVRTSQEHIQRTGILDATLSYSNDILFNEKY